MSHILKLCYLCYLWFMRNVCKSMDIIKVLVKWRYRCHLANVIFFIRFAFFPDLSLSFKFWPNPSLCFPTVLWSAGIANTATVDLHSSTQKLKFTANNSYYWVYDALFMVWNSFVDLKGNIKPLMWNCISLHTFNLAPSGPN